MNKQPISLRFKPAVAFMCALLASLGAGFFRAEYGWHNGLMFLLVAIIIGLSTYELREYRGIEAIPQLIPSFITVAVIVLVSVLTGYAGIALASGPVDFGALASYAVAALVFGFVSCCLSVNNAAHADTVTFAGGLLVSLVTYAVMLIVGLMAVAAEGSDQFTVVGGYAVVAIIASLFFMFNSARVRYS